LDMELVNTEVSYKYYTWCKIQYNWFQDVSK